MKKVFEALSGLEAHLIAGLLQQEAIECRIDGEYLQAGMGELPAINQVWVLVDESDYENARKIINDWEQTEVDSKNPHPPSKKSSGIGIGLFFGLLIGSGLTYWVYNSPVTVDGIDHNSDGKLDQKWTYRDHRLYRTENDRNMDGNIDEIHQFNSKGIVYQSKLDENFDGIYETIYKYNRRGIAYRQESDLNQDGHADYLATFKHGILSEIEILGPDTNSPKKKQTYRMNKLVSSEFDSNGDGVYDTFYEYDYYEEVKTKSNNVQD